MTPAIPASCTSETPRLFRGEYLPFALGAIGLVTLAALENRAVMTVLPTLVREFDALTLFGLANVAPAASFVLALAIGGAWADRQGPAPVLRLGVACFALAQVLVGAAPAMTVVILGRLLSGIAEGLIDIGLMVLIARALPDALRPRMFALFAAMWVLPSLVAPLLTGYVTAAYGWRWVFLGALFFLGPTWLLLRPALRSTAQQELSEQGEPETSPFGWALAASTAFFALSLAGGYVKAHPLSAALGGGVALTVLLATTGRLVPPGTASFRRGLPAVVAVRGLSSAAFGGTGALLPLILTLLHGVGPQLTGVSLSVTGSMWAFGSFLQGRDHRHSRVGVLRTGLALMTLGLSGSLLVTVPDLPPWFGLAGWAVAAIGMGLTSPTLSLLTLDNSTSSDQGRNSGAAQMAGSIATAVSFAVSGALIAVADPAPGPRTFATVMALSIACAATSFLVATRVEAEAVKVSEPLADVA